MFVVLVVPSTSSSSVSKLSTESALLVLTDCSSCLVERDTKDGIYPEDSVLVNALDRAVATEGAAMEDVVNSDSITDGQSRTAASEKWYCCAAKRSLKPGMSGLCQLLSLISFWSSCDEHAAKVHGATDALSKTPLSALVSELLFDMLNDGTND